MPKKFRPAGDYGLLKASTLKVKANEAHEITGPNFLKIYVLDNVHRQTVVSIRF